MSTSTVAMTALTMLTRALLLLGALSVASSVLDLELQGASSPDQLQSMEQDMPPFPQPTVNEHVEPDHEPVDTADDQGIVLRDWCRNNGHYDWIFCAQAYLRYKYGDSEVCQKD